METARVDAVPARGRRPVVVALFVLIWLHALPASADSSVTYRPPVDAPVTDPFRAPATPYGAGNRGLDYATEPGTLVRAAAAGQVVFAGQVAGSLHVTVLHPDGLRTSYSFLATITVAQGNHIDSGDVVGTTGTMLHFGVRRPDDTYLDPASLLAGAADVSHLVPGIDEGRDPLHERRALLQVALDRAAALGSPLAGVVRALDQRLAIVAHYASELSPLARAGRLRDTLERWWRLRSSCTPPEVAPPPPPSDRRIAILVAGFASTSGHAGVDDVDTAALGYAPDDVVRFSYAGGRTPAPAGPAFATIEQRPYDAADSEQDILVSADRLATLVAAVSQREPGVPIDLIAHSQGGVVLRLALARADDAGLLPGAVATAITIGTPHSGDDAATGIAAAVQLGGWGPELDAAHGGLLPELDPGSPAAAQLAETSTLTAELERSRIPPQVRFLAIGGTGDPVVALPHTTVVDQPAAMVDVVGPTAHDRLPGLPATTREIALALGGAPPTCRSLVATLSGWAIGESVAMTTDALGMAAAAAGLAAGTP